MHILLILSSLFLSIAVTAPTQALYICLLLLGLFFTSIGSKVNTFVTQLTNGNVRGGSKYFLTSIIPIILCMFIIASLYGVISNKSPKKWVLPFPAFVLIAVVAGISIHLPKSTSEITTPLCFGLLMLPLIHVGVWLGTLLRRFKTFNKVEYVEESQVTKTQTGRFFLGIVISIFVIFMINVYQTSQNSQTQPRLIPMTIPLNNNNPLRRQSSRNLNVYDADQGEYDANRK